MNPSQFSPDNPLLTAYALGEIDESDRAIVEAALAADPSLRATVNEIRATVDQLSAALASEPLPVVSSRAIEINPGRARGPFMAKLIRLPQSYYLIGGLAAAGFAVLVFLQQPAPHEVRDEKSLLTVNLPSPSETEGHEMVGAPLNKITEPSSDVLAADAIQEKPATLAEKDKSAVTSPGSLISSVRDELAQEKAARLSPSKDQLAHFQNESFQNSKVRKSAEVGKASLTSPPAGTRYVSAIDAANKKSEIVFDGSGNVQRQAELLSSGATSVSGGNIRRHERQFQPGEPVQKGAASRGNGVFGQSESYGTVTENKFVAVAAEPLSTFSIDVDTASYSNVRRFLNSGQLPPRDAVRVEELVNYFPYRYPSPKDDTAFAATLEVAAAPWENSHRLVRIGLKGREVSLAARPAANLVFLLDVSGSMDAPNRLPLVKESMRLLISRLRADDHVAIVTYAGQSGLALPSTPVAQANEILAALEELSPGGSTNGERGIQLAYDIAKANFVSGGVNRVILCTDGDFNVGVSNRGDLVRLVEEKAKANVFLTVLGFGMGNLKDDTLESLADKGNGNYGYIDSRREAEKLLVEQVGGTLVTIAKDVKIQVEFNPAQVRAYRLIGYENRMLQKEDFNNDKVDAGEIGAGHTVTALYEVIPAGVDPANVTSTVDDLKYQTTSRTGAKAERGAEIKATMSRELLTVKVRYKEPASDVSRRLEFPLMDSGSSFAAATGDFKFAAAVAEFGLTLRSGLAKPGAFSEVMQWAEAGLNEDAGGHRAEFLGLVRRAQSLMR